MWKSKKIEDLNIETTCRSCLEQSDQLTSLFAVADNNELSFGDLLANVSYKKFNLYNIIDLPTKICDLCHEDLLIAYNFKIKSEKSENILHEYLQHKNSKIEQIAVPVENNYGFINIKSEQSFDNKLVTEKSEEEEDINADCEYVCYDNINYSHTNSNISEDYGDDKQIFIKTKVSSSRHGYGKYHCHLCKSRFTTQSLLNNHIKIHDRGEANKFYCSSCDKCFVGKKYLQRHIKLHLKEKPTNQVKPSRVSSSKNDPICTDVQCENSDNEIYPPDEITKDDLKLDIKIFKPETKLSFNVQKNYACQHCSSRFSNQLQLDCHMKAHSAKKFFCEACDRYFVNNRNLQRHLKLHYNPNEFKCSQCKKTFESKLRWKLHERSHSIKETTISEYNFDKHSCLPNETKTLECKICSTTFTKICLLRAHLQTHTNPETYDIENIRKSNYLINLVPDGGSDLSKVIEYIVTELQDGRNENFYSATNMVGNELRLSDSETDTDSENSKKAVQHKCYSCELCEQTFTRRYKILYHQQYDHKDDELENECGICEMKYASKNLLNYHIKTQCGNTEKHFTCEVCKIKYMWKENIQRHIRIHHKNEQQQSVKLFRQFTPTKKFECDICKKTFTRLDRHQRTHNLEKKFQCGICLKKFRRKDTMQVHMKVHGEYYDYASEESKLYLCVFCGRKFRSSSNLAVHTRRHTGEKPYKCDFCDRAFPSSSDLNTHRRTHSGENLLKVKG